MRYRLRTLLLAITFVSIALGGEIAAWKHLWPNAGWFFVEHMLTFSPAWIPLAFTAYVIGRRKLTVTTVIAFAISELAAYGWLVWDPNIFGSDRGPHVVF